MPTVDLHARWDVRTAELDTLTPLRFAVIFARYQGQWLYSRHKARNTWETAGGHIEPGETPLDAAKRELFEETGALDFTIRPAFDYAVAAPDETSNGQVYYAEINTLGDLPDSEMGEVRCFDTIPDVMTHPQILPVLYERMKTFPIAP